ncbi:MAG: tetratricopeptide repeat protein [Gammaproteobacteria bacterium]|nr:tetratricopeptide repeat protein [Gammaproteobacteria bacterium]MBT8133867.1 tetratricopeptide repeat protein [Gammaproteobacteria bacterium]NNJ49704.1 tetratricopeptide repeat protein [Gammaproteobacteria bacterium]
MSSYIIDVTSENFNDAVLSNSHKGPVMVNYWAENAGPCLRLWPVLEKLANDYNGQFLLVNIDTGKEKRLAQDYGVNSVPTVKLFINGEVIDQIHGYDSADSFKKMLDKHLARESDKALAAAVAEYQKGNKEVAFEQLGKQVFIDPENPRILLTLTKLLMKEEAYDQAYALLEKTPLKDENEEAAVLMTNALFLSTVQQADELDALEKQLEENPDDKDILFNICSQRMMQSNYTAAMDILLKIIKLDYSWREGIASLCLRGLFIMLGKENPIVIEYRQKLIDQQAH